MLESGVLSKFTKEENRKWHSENLDEDGLVSMRVTNISDSVSNFKTPSQESTESSSSIQKEALKDSYNHVFLIFALLGFGSLLPWNLFIIISYDYYENFKLLENGTSTWFSSNFQNTMTISAQIPSLIFNILSIFSGAGKNLLLRMLICLSLVEGVILFTMSFVYVNVEQWVRFFFCLTVLSIIILNSVNGLFQNSMFGLVSPFPFKYTNAIILGQNFCGIAVTVLSITTRFAVSHDVQLRVILYFSIAGAVVLLCLIMLKLMTGIKFYQEYGNLKSNHEKDEINLCDDIKYALKKSKMQFFNVYMLFFVTLCIFPNICMYVSDEPKGGEYSFFIPKEYFKDTVVFMNFSVFAFVGSILANWKLILGPKSLWLVVLARFWFLFYFPATNYMPEERKFPVLMHSTWFFIINVSALAFTSGYFSSLAMMYAPRECEKPHQKRTAGMLAAMFLIFGIVSGLGFSWIVKLIIVS